MELRAFVFVPTTIDFLHGEADDEAQVISNNVVQLVNWKVNRGSGLENNRR